MKTLLLLTVSVALIAVAYSACDQDASQKCGDAWSECAGEDPVDTKKCACAQEFYSCLHKADCLEDQKEDCEEEEKTYPDCDLGCSSASGMFVSMGFISLAIGAAAF